MNYRTYQHIEKLGNSEVEGILKGTCSIQPKIDGTNGVVWLGDDGLIHAGSRKRDLTLENDNAGFYAGVINNESINKYLKAHKNRYLYGEWLVPHTIKYYDSEAWRKFYVFDVFEDGLGYLPYDAYSKELDEYEITYIPEIARLNNPTIDELSDVLKSTKYIIPEDKMSEGIVIKNYDYLNNYGRKVWAKIVAAEFFGIKQEARDKRHNAKKNNPSENEIVTLMLSEALIRKEFAKIKLEFPSAKKQEIIGRLLNNIWHVFLNEEFTNYAEKKKPKVDFIMLKKACDNSVKEVLSNELFS